MANLQMQSRLKENKNRQMWTRIKSKSECRKL